MVRVRFAPSPTGTPHIGNTRTALFNYLFAKSQNGTFILRIEDTDQTRFSQDSQQDIIDILKVLDLKPDEGPYIQSQRLDLYQKYAQKLVDNRSAYRCFCSFQRLQKLRLQQQKKHQRPGYDRLCRHLSSSQIKSHLNSKTPFTIRLKMGDDQVYSWQDLIQGKLSLPAAEIDDKVLLKSDGYPTYHLAVVVDDHLMKITHVFRGVEYISTAPLHLRIYEKLGFKPPVFCHLPLILGPDKSKLSKRHGAKSVLEYTQAGFLPEAITNFMVYLGWSFEDNSKILSLKDLIKIFPKGKLQKQSATFDIDKLTYFNSAWIRNLDNNNLMKRLKPFIPNDCPQSMIEKILPLIKQRLNLLSDFENLTSYFYRSINVDFKLLHQQSKQSKSEIATALNQTLKAYSQIPRSKWKAKTLESVGKKLLEITAWKPRQLFMTIRVALTNKVATPPLFDTMQVLGKNLCLKRLKRCHQLN